MKEAHSATLPYNGSAVTGEHVLCTIIFVGKELDTMMV